MKVPDLKLDEISFQEAPTKTQIVNTLNSINDFLGNMAASLVLDRSYKLGDEALGMLMNNCIQLRACADRFENGPNVGGLATPNPHPNQVRR